MMTRFEVIERIEVLIERLYAHDELTASGFATELDQVRYTGGINRLLSLLGDVEVVLGAYETLGV